MHEEKVIVRKGGVGSMLSGFLLGSLIGAGIALLNAPRPGPETRQILREKSTEIKDQVVEQAGQTRDKAQHVLENARGMVSDVANTTREKAADLLHREGDMLDDASRKVHNLAEDTSRTGGGAI